MADVPGRIGWPFVGDKSIEFSKDPIKFLRKNMDETNSMIFAARILNKPTVFIGSHAGVIQVLDDNINFELGYKTFFDSMFGNVIIFFDGKRAHELRTCLMKLFSDDCLLSYQSIIEEVIATVVQNVDESPIPLYKFFKEKVTQICLRIFLGLNLEESRTFTEAIITLTKTHWQGITSVPLSIRLPGKDYATSYSRALEAKKQLLDLIKSRREENHHFFLNKIKEAMSSSHDDDIDDHLLLFISSLIPKIVASLLTSVSIHISKDCQEQLLDDPNILENIYLETQRLYPPLIVSRRVAKKDVTIDGYLVPAGYGVMCLLYAAHRDGYAFDQPEEFLPERWNNSGKQKKLFSFGSGPRCCVGKQLVDNIVKTVITSLVSMFQIQLMPDQNLDYTWLPVCKPKHDVFCQFLKKIDTS